VWHRFCQHAHRGRLATIVSCILVVTGVSINAWPSFAVHAVQWARPRAAGAWPTRVATNPIAITVDERTQRVFVVGEGPPSKPYYLSPSGPGSVSVLDATTGALVRTTRVGMDPVQAVLDMTAGRLYVLSQEPFESGTTGPVRPGSVSVLDATTGALVRTTRVGINAVALAVDERHGRVFALAREPQASDDPSSGDTSVLDAATGALIRTFPRTGGTALAVSARTGRLFVASALSCPPARSVDDQVNPGCLDVLDATTGRRVATHPLSQTVGLRAMAVDDPAGRVVALLEGMRGGVVDAQYASHAAVFDATTGALLHSAETSSSRQTYAFALNVAVGRAAVVVGPDGYDIQNHSGGADVGVVETRGGRVLRTVGRAVGPSGLAAGVVIDARIGRVVALTQPLSDVRKAPDGLATLTMLDARTGRLLHTAHGQAGDVALGLDAQRGRLFVANARSNTVRMLDVTRL